MTTAHRPTWRPAYGGPEQGGYKQLVPSRQYSVRDMAGQMQLKERKNPKEQEEDTSQLEQQLKEEEIQFKKQQRDQDLPGYSLNKKIKLNEDKQKNNLLDLSDSDSDEEENKDQSSDDELLKAAASAYQNPFPQDEDDKNLLQESSDSDSDELLFYQLFCIPYSDDEDNKLLMQEFQRIKKEKEEDEKKKLQEKEEENKRKKQTEIMKGNPLLDRGSYSLNKRWYEDTVFKNQAQNESKQKKRYINDSVRSDFHKKFMTKFIQN